MNSISKQFVGDTDNSFVNKPVAIACGCRKLNYGSILQSYALCSIIKEIGYKCEFVWISGSLFKHYNIRVGKIVGVLLTCFKHPKLFKEVFNSVLRIKSKKSSYSLPEESIELFDRFVKDNITINYYSWSKLKRLGNTYRKYICGSDQIWNSYELYLDPMYFLRFAPDKKRIAYGPSLGTDSIANYNKTKFEKYVRGINNISCREISGSKICEQIIKRNVPVVLDPTLLMNKEKWNCKFKLEKKCSEYCLVYFLNSPSEEAIRCINSIKNHMPIKIVPKLMDSMSEEMLEIAGPKEFLDLLYNAHIVITDSFHGTIFSINFHKNFICYERQYGSNTNQSSRIISILSQLDLMNRYCVDELDLKNILQNDIDYRSVDIHLEKLRENSLLFLKKALDE